MWLAATNKCLAQNSKSGTGVRATNERPAARRYRDKAREKAINVASVTKRKQDWVLLTMRGGVEHTVIGTVESVMEKLNKAETVTLLSQAMGEDK